MISITQSGLWSFLNGKASISKVASLDEIIRNPGHVVSNLAELTQKIAELQTRNPSFLLMFRGQRKDYPNVDGTSCLKPSIFRPMMVNNRLTDPPKDELKKRFVALDFASGFTRTTNHPVHHERLKKLLPLRWSILQHYEVCDTPLLDVSVSLRVAASFASQSPPPENNIVETGFIFVLAMPHPSGVYTVVDDFQMIRLSNLCPADAQRPHAQEGFLLGSYPDIRTPSDAAEYNPPELDFNNRLLAKFTFNSKSFWKQTPDPFPIIGNSYLYPEHDNFFTIMKKVKEQTKASVAFKERTNQTLSSPKIKQLKAEIDRQTRNMRKEQQKMIEEIESQTRPHNEAIEPRPKPISNASPNAVTKATPPQTTLSPMPSAGANPKVAPNHPPKAAPKSVLVQPKPGSKPPDKPKIVNAPSNPPKPNVKTVVAKPMTSLKQVPQPSNTTVKSDSGKV